MYNNIHTSCTVCSNVCCKAWYRDVSKQINKTVDYYFNYIVLTKLYQTLFTSATNSNKPKY